MNDPAWSSAEAVDFVGVSPPRFLIQVVLGLTYSWTTSIRTSKDGGSPSGGHFGMLELYNVSFTSLGKGSTGPRFCLSRSHHFVKL